MEEIFHRQLENCGVESFDYYLLHNVNGIRYRQIIRDAHLFEHMKQWKADGKIKHIAFSFHDTADVLDQILTEHPEVEAVQIAVNYYDWNSYLVQSRACYEVIRRHGKQVIIMEPVKGGMLAEAPEAAEGLLRSEHPDWSPAAWALRFAAGLDGRTGGALRDVHVGTGRGECSYLTGCESPHSAGTEGLGGGRPAVPGERPRPDRRFLPV